MYYFTFLISLFNFFIPPSPTIQHIYIYIYTYLKNDYLFPIFLSRTFDKAFINSFTWRVSQFRCIIFHMALLRGLHCCCMNLGIVNVIITANYEMRYTRLQLSFNAVNDRYILLLNLAL